MPDLLVPHRFCGPPSSGNGGYTAGALATLVDAPTVSVSLLAPPPLDTSMPVEVVDGLTVASRDGAPVARAEAAGLDASAVEAVAIEEARAVERAFVGLASHPFPTCFVCGPDRSDGLRIFPGPAPTRTVGPAWPPPGPRTTASPTTSPPSPGRRSTASAAGRAGSRSGRWCSPG